MFVVLYHVKVYRPVGLVGITIVKDLLHELLLLNDVACGVRLDAWRQHVEFGHGSIKAVGVVLCHLHGFELFEACFLGYLVLALIGIVLKVSHIGDVAHIAHLVAKVLEVTEHEVKGDGGTGMAQMSIAINGGTAHIHAHMSGVDRGEQFLAARQRIVKE